MLRSRTINRNNPDAEMFIGSLDVPNGRHSAFQIDQDSHESVTVGTGEVGRERNIALGSEQVDLDASEMD